MSIARQILSNTVFQMAGRIGVALLGVLTVKMITNYLPSSQYGAYSVVYDFLAMFGIAADFGLFTIAVREMAHDEDKVEKILGNIIGIRFVLALIVLSMGVFVGSLVYDDPAKIYGIMIAAVATFLALMQGTVASVLQVKLKMQYVSFSHVLGKVSQVIYIALVAFVLFADKSQKGIGFYHLLAAGIVANATMFLICYYFARKEVKIRMYFDFDYWKEIVSKALPYGFALALATIYLRVDSFMLSKLKDDNEVAYYAVAVRVLEALRILPLYFVNSTLPSLTRSIKLNDGGHKKIIQYSVEFMLALSLPIIIGGGLLAYNIVALVSNPDYLSRIAEGFYGSDVALRILLFETSFSFLNAIFVFALIAMHKQGKTIWINGGAALLNVGLNFLLIPVWGFRGAGFTTILSEAFVLVVAFLMVRKYLSFRIELKNIGKIFFSAVVMGVVIYAVKELVEGLIGGIAAANLIVLAAVIPLGGVVYLLMLFLSGAVTKDMLRMLKKSDAEKESVG